MPEFYLYVSLSTPPFFFHSFVKIDMSKNLLAIARRGVEIAIEQDENSAEYWIKSEIEDLGIDIDT